MSTLPTTTTGTVAVPAAAGKKALDLATLKKGAKDYLDFMDDTKEVFFAYLYHRTGSVEAASAVIQEVYTDLLSRAMSLWWFGSLGLKLLLDRADAALKSRDTVAADIEKNYLKNLAWLSADERKSVATMHDALWSLPRAAGRLLILSLLVGLSDARIAEVLGMKKEDVKDQLKTSKDMLLERWQPVASVAGKLDSLVFMPALDIQSETKLRFSVVEKYNALRFRRYQWVIIGGLFAVMSNVIVASVLAFAVIVQPATSLRGVKSEVASLDAALLQRQLAVNEAKASVAASFDESKRLAAYSVSRDLTALGLASALEALKAQQAQEKETDRLIKLMQRAQTAQDTELKQAVRLALEKDKPRPQIF